MKNKIGKFRCGDKVRVSSGVMEPDLGDNIEGWSGEINEVDFLEGDSWIYHITLDKDTLSILSDDYITRCESNNFRYEYLCLKENELDLLNNRGNYETGELIA